MFLSVRNIIRIYHECEGGIEKSVPRISVWHCMAIHVIINSDQKSSAFLVC